MAVKQTISGDTATLSSETEYTVFSYGDTVLRFLAPYSLRRYMRVKKWQGGRLSVDADYGDCVEEDYIDLNPILQNLLIDADSFLKPIRKVEVRYA